MNRSKINNKNETENIKKQEVVVYNAGEPAHFGHRSARGSSPLVKGVT